MKKIKMIATIFLLCSLFSNAHATIKLAVTPDQPFKHGAYVGKIVGANYVPASNTAQEEILLFTTAAPAKNETQLKGAAITINGKDIPFGLTLINLIGKKEIAVFFKNDQYEISLVEVITDEFWNASQKF